MTSWRGEACGRDCSTTRRNGCAWGCRTVMPVSRDLYAPSSLPDGEWHDDRHAGDIADSDLDPEDRRQAFPGEDPARRAVSDNTCCLDDHDTVREARRKRKVMEHADHRAPRRRMPAEGVHHEQLI